MNNYSHVNLALCACATPIARWSLATKSLSRNNGLISIMRSRICHDHPCVHLVLSYFICDHHHAMIVTLLPSIMSTHQFLQIRWQLSSSIAAPSTTAIGAVILTVADAGAIPRFFSPRAAISMKKFNHFLIQSSGHQTLDEINYAHIHNFRNFFVDLILSYLYN